MQADNFVHSPMTYTGSKGKLLSLLLPLFPDNICTLYDMFCGGLSVTLNTDAEKYVANDICRQLICMYNHMRIARSAMFMHRVDKVISKYAIDDLSVESYTRLRDDYNFMVSARKETEFDSAVMLFVLIAYSYNSVVRFNSDGEFNTPAGKQNNNLNPKRREALKEFIDTIVNKHVLFTAMPFNEAMPQIEHMDKNDFVYCDPPYMITSAEYNKLWSYSNEYLLYSTLDKLNAAGVRFGLSNVVRYKGKFNHVLADWMNKYTVHFINKDAYAGSYRVKRKEDDITQEVFVCNY